MKLRSLSPAMVICLLLSWSCKSPCGDTPVNGIWINNFNGITDTIAEIKKYRAGTNFNVPGEDTLVYRSNQYYYVFLLGFDYTITILPAGKLHRLTHFRKGDEKQRPGNGLQSDECHFSVSYVIDDSVVEIKEQFGNSAYAFVYITN